LISAGWGRIVGWLFVGTYRSRGQVDVACLISDAVTEQIASAIMVRTTCRRNAVRVSKAEISRRAARERNIVRNMVDRGAVRCIIDLPGHLFRESTAAVAVWILAHPGDDARPEVLLIDARAAARKDVPTHRGSLCTC
jgi:hypothetical protein